MMSCCFGRRRSDDKERDDNDNTHSDNDNDHDTDEVESESESENQSEEDTDETEDVPDSNPKPQEAEDYIAVREKGSLKISLVGPTKRSSKILGSVSIAGETGKGVEEESPGYEHPAFEQYWIKEKFLKQKRTRGSGASPDYEVVRYFDREADPKYHHVRPGTVTVQGYGTECWEYEETHSGPRDAERKYLYHLGPLPEPGSKELLRRLNELQNGGERAFGENPELDEADLEEFVGQALELANGEKDIDAMLRVCCAVLSRQDTFKDFAGRLSIAQEWTHVEQEGVLGMFNFFWQMVITGEVARRLDSGAEMKGKLNRMTIQVVASLIVYDLWMQNLEVKINHDGLPKLPEKEVSPEQRTEAKALLRVAEKFMDETEPQTAAKILEDAVAIDPANVEYRRRRCLALCRTAELDAIIGDDEDSEMRYIEAAVEAQYLTLYEPDAWQSWELLAETHMGRGAFKKSLQAYEQAQSVATSAADKEAMGKKVVEARVALVQEFLAATGIEDKVEQYEALRYIKDWDFDFLGGSVKFLSKVHERQEEGLVAFAKSIKWPLVEEACERVGNLYARIQAGQEAALPANLHDWLYGLVLPGRFFAYNVMTCLVLCTPSLSLGVAAGATYSLILGDIAYWTTQTVMGRVLATIPNVRSLAGWVGPCPSVELDLENEKETEPKARWVNVVADPVPPTPQHTEPKNDDPLRFRDSDDPDSYVAEIKDPEKWTVPKPPARDESHYTLKSIHLKATGEKEGNNFTAKITFEVNNGKTTVEIPLRTNPVFVAPPGCHSPDAAGHPIHARELELYPTKTWTPDKLVDDDNFANAHVASAIVINATGDGAETMARALCALRGINAVIRTSGGPCFACAMRAARELKTGALIWCD